MSKNNSNIIVSQANIHISNINRLLKDVKSEVSANFICSNNKGVIIITNKVVATLDLNIVEVHQRVQQYQLKQHHEPSTSPIQILSQNSRNILLLSQHKFPYYI